MNKSNIRGYVVSAFRYYSRMGEPDKNEIEKSNNLTEAEKLDLSAVASMLEYLSARGDVSALAAVREIYFVEPTRKLERNEISRRVIRYALDNYVSERTVYYSLERAWKVFTDIRVLRLER